MSTDLRARWETLRYGTLLPWAARSRRAGGGYARLCAGVESRLDAGRCRAASARIERWLAIDARRAAAVARAALYSEAREEADVSWYMRHPNDLAGAFRTAAPPPAGADPAIWATLHLGSPNLAFVYLRRLQGLDLRLMARPLDDSNPMSAAKRAWGRRKVAWLEHATATEFLGTSAEDLGAARARLVKGRSLFALMDVPGDIVARAATISLCGERVRLAAGLFVLAAIAGVPVRPVVAVAGAGRIDMHYGNPIAPVGKDPPLEAIGRELEAIIRRWPGEWWLWPYLPAPAEER